MKVKMPRLSVSSFTKPSRTPTSSSESQRRLLEADRRWRVKSILRAFAALFSLVGFSLFAAAIPKWDEWFYWSAGPSRGDWQDGLPTGVVCVVVQTTCMLWIMTLMFHVPARDRLHL